MLETFFEILKFTIPSLVVFGIAYSLISGFFNKQVQLKELEIEQENLNKSFPISLQAYERLILFLERINPSSLITRLRDSNMTAVELQYAMVASIRGELDHNITQQLYISEGTWVRVKAVTEELISTINQIAARLPNEASANDLSYSLLQYFASTEGILPNEQVINRLKLEAKEKFDF